MSQQKSEFSYSALRIQHPYVENESIVKAIAPVTLALGLMIAWGWQHRTLLNSAMALITAAIAYVLDDPLMYGFYGALVPAAVFFSDQ